MPDSDSGDEDPQLVEEKKLKITIQSATKESVDLVVKQTVALEKVARAWGAQVGVTFEEYTFSHNGDVISMVNTPNTPKVLGWEVGRTYIMDAFRKKDGGGADAI